MNEAGEINELIARLRESDPRSSAELIAVDGDPAGGTVGVIADRGVLKVVSGRGRGRQMNLGASLARGAVLLFLHADTRLPGNALALIEAALGERGIIGGAFDLGFDTNRRIFQITEKYVFLRTRLTRVPFGDQAIFIRRDYFEKLGGYRDIPIMEDVELMKRIRKRGGRIRIIREKVRTSPRRYEAEGLIRCTLRNW
ncbi:MAG TPA: TIGR04283 family arsenosugar biosynthesis glycosyltransferase, partial [Nitrospirota bacterium]